jgi:outer membrane immunogenic protein
MRRQWFGLLPVLAIAAFAATAAVAADLPVAPRPAPAYYPPPPAHYNWSGFYFGGNVGVGLVRDVVTAGATTVFADGGVLPIGTKTNVSPYALIGGPEVGMNLQFGPAVVGVEGTWTSSYITGNYTAPLGGTGGQEQSRSAPHWYWTATGKLGFAANDLLFYAKGGAAGMRVDYTQSELNAAGGLVSQQTLATNRNGWTAGAGIEYALNENLSAKLEYDFLSFGTRNYIFPNVAPGGLPISVQSQTHMILLGVNYRFYFGGFGQY